MTPQERLAAHLKTRPETPSPFPPFTSWAYKKWRDELDKWSAKKDDLEKETLPKLDFVRQQPSVPPSQETEYIPRQRGRKRGSVVPGW